MPKGLGRILRFYDLKERGIVGSRMTLWRRQREAGFPQPVAIGGGVGWFESEIDEWLASLPRKAAPSVVEAAE